MRADNKLKIRTWGGLLTLGWGGLIADSLDLTPFNVHVKVFVLLGLAIVAGTVIYIGRWFVYGPLLYKMMQLGQATELERQKLGHRPRTSAAA